MTKMSLSKPVIGPFRSVQIKSLNVCDILFHYTLGGRVLSHAGELREGHQDLRASGRRLP